MTSGWIKHVLGYKKEHNVSFTDALKQASKTYKKGGDTTPDVKVGGNCNMLKGGKKSRKQRRSARRSRRNRKTKTRR